MMCDVRYMMGDEKTRKRISLSEYQWAGYQQIRVRLLEY